VLPAGSRTRWADIRVTSTNAGLATAVVLLFLIVGCGSTTAIVPIPEESAAKALQSELESAGLDVAWMTGSQRSDLFDSDVRRAALQIDGSDSSIVNLYRFATAEKAAAAAGRVGRGGSPVPVDGGVAYPLWAGRPHFYRQGRLIALFCESGSMKPTRRDRAVLAALQEVLGPQCAGSSYEQP
jgi:hypothetical protein